MRLGCPSRVATGAGLGERFASARRWQRKGALPACAGGACACVCVCVHAHARRWQEEKVKILQVLCNFLAQLFSLFNLPIPTKVLPFLRKKEERK